jgi:hypothetical protein
MSLADQLQHGWSAGRYRRNVSHPVLGANAARAITGDIILDGKPNLARLVLQVKNYIFVRSDQIALETELSRRGRLKRSTLRKFCPFVSVFRCISSIWTCA